ncbi:hypothetical protein THRCLA_20052 [Thraustotheca clavata]|uniref:Ion transport domain-containing protein n=1 Tax=Thraustotheca clavata TaxID=74557 RepID=A0A1W0ACE9_9STRA|nr:hypothetical protein THRCLA_20052 [Thraustotheca clavata]
MYLQQLALYCMLLMTMLLSVSMSREASGAETNPKFPYQLMVWLYIGSMLCVVYMALFWYKTSTSRMWTGCTLLILIAWYVILQFLYGGIESWMENNSLWFVRMNNIVLAPIAFYVLTKEIEEWVPELSTFCDAKNWSSKLLRGIVYYLILIPMFVVLNFLLRPFTSTGKADYYSSAFNHIQIPTYVGVLFYVVNEFTAITTGDAQIYLGIVLSFILWFLSLEYLEVHPTIGYLLPMMRAMAVDMKRFLIFYAPFQCAYTSAYYFLFQGRNEPTYNTIGEAFITTFLVVLGQIDLDPFNTLSGASYVAGYIILLTHATLVIVMLLNVIVAMMSKTMEDSFEQSKMKAIVSFAVCVLRCEKTAGLNRITVEAAKKILKHLDNRIKQKDSETEDEELEDYDINFSYRPDDDDFQLKELSTDDRIDSLEEKLNDRIKGLEKKLDATEATLKQLSLKIAVVELNKCKTTISEIVKLYCDDKTFDITDTPLYLILNAKPKPSNNIEPRRLLAHYAMEKVVHLKWEVRDETI